MKLAIRQAREKWRWTQKYVADQTGITQAMLQKIETGQRRPSFDVLVKLEDLFGMDYRDLFNLPRRQPRDNRKEPDGNQARS